MQSLAQFLKLFSDETRLRCIYLIHKNKSVCVCELTYALELSQPKISRHLTPLRKFAILSDKKIGKWVYYSINSNLDENLKQLLNNILNTYAMSDKAKNDVKMLNTMKNRPKDLSCC